MKRILTFTLVLMVLGGAGWAQEKPKPPDKPVAVEMAKAAEVPFSAEQVAALDVLQLKLQLNSEQIARRQVELQLLQQQGQDLGKEAQALMAGWTKPGYRADLQARKYLLEPPKKDEAKPTAPPRGPGD